MPNTGDRPASTGPLEPYEIREEAASIIGEDRVPGHVLAKLLAVYGDSSRRAVLQYSATVYAHVNLDTGTVIKVAVDATKVGDLEGVLSPDFQTLDTGDPRVEAARAIGEAPQQWPAWELDS